MLPMTARVAALATLIATGCSKPEPAPAPPAEAPTAAAKAPAAPGGVVDNQTLDQMLERTMNRFARLDLNGDGRLSQDELNAATEGGDQTVGDAQRPREGRSARAFERADTNGDGVVTRQEAEAQTRERFKRLDADTDGKVSRDELISNFAGKGKARPATGAQ